MNTTIQSPAEKRHPTHFEISQTRDGSLVLSCGDDGMESDLVFASGAMHGDPVLEKQRALLEWIVSKLSDSP